MTIQSNTAPILTRTSPYMTVPIHDVAAQNFAMTLPYSAAPLPYMTVPMPRLTTPILYKT